MIKTLHDVIRRLSELSNLVDADDLLSKNTNFDLIDDFPDMYNFANRPQALHEVVTTVHTLTSDLGLPTDKLPAVLNPLFKEHTFYGAYHELAAYRWLNYSGVQYTPQPKLAAGQLLNQGGPTDLDGHFTYANVYFDIKSFGFEYAIKEAYRRRLTRALGTDVIIDGSMNNAIDDISAAFTQIDTTVRDMQHSGRSRIADLDWDIRTRKPDERVAIETTWTDPYHVAQENCYYPLIHAKQFTRSEPFLLVFAFDQTFNGPLHVNFADHADVLFRSICRRTFMQSRRDNRSISALGTAYHKQIDGNLTVLEVAGYLSAVLFVNVQNRRSWLYINPNAVNPISTHRVDEMFGFDFPPKMHLDQFVYDNY